MKVHFHDDEYDDDRVRRRKKYKEKRKFFRFKILNIHIVLKVRVNSKQIYISLVDTSKRRDTCCA